MEVVLSGASCVCGSSSAGARGAGATPFPLHTLRRGVAACELEADGERSGPLAGARGQWDGAGHWQVRESNVQPVAIQKNNATHNTRIQCNTIQQILYNNTQNTNYFIDRPILVTDVQNTFVQVCLHGR